LKMKIMEQMELYLFKLACRDSNNGQLIMEN
jgi:hypothetical protein